MTRKINSPAMMPESRKSEIRYVTNDPARMLGKFIARRAIKTWKETLVDDDTKENVEIERSQVLFERGTYIDRDVLSSITFMMQEGSLAELEVSNQNRQGILLENNVMFLYKAAAKIDDKKKTFLLYATSVHNALDIITDYIELHFRGGFEVAEVKALDYCVILIDSLRPAEARRYELDVAYLKGEMPTEDFAIATADQIAKGNQYAEEEEAQKETKKFYQIKAKILRRNEEDKEDLEDSGDFIVQTVSAVRANMLIQKYLQDKQEERYQESLSRPDARFIRYEIHSFIEESKIIPIGSFIPVAFSEVYSDEYDS